MPKSLSLKIALLICIVIAIFVRFYRFNEVPPSLNWDEASLGYNAYSILKTGRDEWGRNFPLTFEAFGDYKLPGYIYTDVPFIALLGLNSLAVRLPSVLAGIAAVLLVFLIAKQLSDNKTIALLSALLLAISPWHLFISRMAVEANLSFTFFLLGLYLFLISFKKNYLFSVSAFLFGLTLFTYSSARIFIPLFSVVLVYLYKDKLLSIKKKLIIPFIIFFVFVLGAGYFAVSKDSNSRYFWVAIVDQGAINYLDQARADSKFNPFLTEIIYNRYTYFGEHFLLNYLSHFSPEFLFLQGGTNYQFSVPNTGLLYFIETPFIIVGVLKLWKDRQKRWVALSWVFLAPIPSAITREAPHVLRAIFMLGGLQLISASGMYAFCEYIKNKRLNGKDLSKPFVVLVFLTLFVSFGFYYHNYSFVYPYQYSSSWQYGYKQAFNELQKLKAFGGKVYITKKYGEPHIFYLFYTKYDPSKYQNNPTLIRYSRSNWRWVDRLDNITFINDWEIKERLKNEKNAILLTSPGNYSSNFTPIQSINFLNGEKAFEIVESK